MKLNNQVKIEIFNQSLKKAMDELGLSNEELAEVVGKHKGSISRIRNGKMFPHVNDFVDILNKAEMLRSGFLKVFAKHFLNQIELNPFFPESFVEDLDPRQLGTLLIYAGERLCQKDVIAPRKQLVS
jgi:transcriptional regulator with XRE-family HTH domain